MTTKPVSFPCAGCREPIKSFMDYFEHWCPELGRDGRSLTVEQWMQLPHREKPQEETAKADADV